MSAEHKSKIARSISVVLAALLLSVAGCVTTPPVQEMSDARQAIAAARAAGAETLAPQVFRRSVNLLRMAERTLERRSYQQARNQAVAARRLAIEAQEQAAEKSAASP